MRRCPRPATSRLNRPGLERNPKPVSVPFDDLFAHKPLNQVWISSGPSSSFPCEIGMPLAGLAARSWRCRITAIAVAHKNKDRLNRNVVRQQISKEINFSIVGIEWNFQPENCTGTAVRRQFDRFAWYIDAPGTA